MKIKAHVLATALIAVACGVLLVAYALICFKTGTAWPWNAVVHEDGRRTLVNTVLYYEHAARELPLDILLALAIGGAAYFAFPAQRPVSWLVLLFLGAVSIGLVALIAVATALEGGASLLVQNLLQNHTRPGAPLVLGSHWRYHLLERFAAILLSLGMAGALLSLRSVRTSPVGRAGLAATGVVVLSFLAVTVVVSPDPNSWLLPFVDPIYLGHQAREALTHSSVTIPLAWGVCLILISPSGYDSVTFGWPPVVGSHAGAALCAGAIGAALVLFVGVAAVGSNAASHGQTSDPIMLVAPHFFEHSFTYAVTPVLALFGYALLSRVRP